MQHGSKLYRLVSFSNYLIEKDTLLMTNLLIKILFYKTLTCKVAALGGRTRPVLSP